MVENVEESLTPVSNCWQEVEADDVPEIAVVSTQEVLPEPIWLTIKEEFALEEEDLPEDRISTVFLLLTIFTILSIKNIFFMLCFTVGMWRPHRRHIPTLDYCKFLKYFENIIFIKFPDFWNIFIKFPEFSSPSKFLTFPGFPGW